MNETENEIEIFRIPEWNVERLEQAIQKLNKRAEKLGVPPLEIVNHGEELVPDPEFTRNVSLDAFGAPMRKIPYEDIPKVKVVLISINGEGPKLAGYTFVGALDHIVLPGSVVVNTVPGQTVPQEYFDNDPVCDHCGKIRRRNQTFVLKHEDGHHTQVGRQCIKDFLGHDPSGIVRLLTAMWKLLESFSDEDNDEWYGRGGGGNRDWQFEHDQVLKATAAIIRTFGWVPRSAADPDTGREATSSIVLDVLIPPYDKYSRKRKEALMENIEWDEEKDQAEAEGAVAWLEEQEANNEYMHNLKAIAKAESVPSRMFGYWCSLVSAYQRAQERLRINLAQKKTNEWVGEEKDKIETIVKVVGLRYFDGRYGTTTLHRMLDEEGRTLTWFASCKSHMDEGMTYRIKGTIKKLDEYNDWKQTVLTRVKMLEEIKDDELRKE